MLNRWQGNTGKVQRINEASFGQKEPFQAAAPQPQSSGNAFENIMKKIEKIVPGAKEPLDNEDIILLLILYLMYRESGDSELLIIMGAMFLL